MRELRAAVAVAAPGARLPSTRALVQRHRVSPLTVQQALRVLAGEGLIESRPGAGTFVRARRPAKAADFGWQTAALRAPQVRARPMSTAVRSAGDDVVAWHSGYPARELLPERLVRAALTRATRADPGLLRPPVAGLPELQAWFARELADATPAGLTPPLPGDVIVLPGSQSGLSSIFRALVSRDRPLVVESPTYWGAMRAAAQVGVDLVPVPSGPAGPDPDELARAFAESGARVFYAQPNFANPTGAQWAPDVADRVLDVVREHGAFLVEDDWAHDFGIDAAARPLAAHDDAGHVVYLRSLTKSVAPGLRVAAVVARGPARERILAERAADAVYVSGLLQAAALDVVTQPGWTTHLRGLRHQLRERRDLLLSSLREHVPQADVEHVPAGGLNLWARLPGETDVGRLAGECERRGLLLGPGDEWFPAEPSAPYVRLNFSGPDPAGFPRGAAILADALVAALAG
ncbi:transcriptional regulator, GntR family [Jatrophihabitans endophyticus]|uniref:Transcriptional regulator, GntR family n=1 Tax=Jatrophihabitans endophyticus TaxID=1206085 RepID=A0A1M5TEZ1_9ACTN|nr:transcriptional regulator, GntR family [Jatrophihabitans endophyticus]